MPCSLATALLSAAAAVAGAAGASDEGCWDGGFGPSYCCRGPGGRAECWDALHSFERCCAGFLSESLPFPDLLAARAGRGPLSPDVAGWSDAGGAAAKLHRRCLLDPPAGSLEEGLTGAGGACRELLELAAEAAASPPPGSQYAGLQHRLVLREYPFAHFVAPALDLFYKAKIFPAAYWGADDFALFEAGFRELLRCGDVVVDAGANIGGYTQMLALSACAGGQVHSFEPFRLTFQLLNANVALAGLVNVHTYRKALSNKPGRSTAQGSDVRDPQQSTIWNSLVMPRAQTLQNENGMLWMEDEADAEEIEHVTLDSLQLPRLDFIKIDVEAMEGHVLLGGIETLQRCLPSILVEIKGFQRRKIHTLLVRDFGYECHSVLSTNPSDFFCAHPDRQDRPRIERVRALWTTDLAFQYCEACRRREPAPVEVDGAP